MCIYMSQKPQSMYIHARTPSYLHSEPSDVHLISTCYVYIYSFLVIKARALIIRYQCECLRVGVGCVYVCTYVHACVYVWQCMCMSVVVYQVVSTMYCVSYIPVVLYMRIAEHCLAVTCGNLVY